MQKNQKIKANPKLRPFCPASATHYVFNKKITVFQKFSSFEKSAKIEILEQAQQGSIVEATVALKLNQGERKKSAEIDEGDSRRQKIK